MNTTIALAATSILSVVLLTTTIVERNQINDLSKRCTSSAQSNAATVKGMMNLLDSSKQDSNAKKIRL